MCLTSISCSAIDLDEDLWTSEVECTYVYVCIYIYIYIHVHTYIHIMCASTYVYYIYIYQELGMESNFVVEDI